MIWVCVGDTGQAPRMVVKSIFPEYITIQYKDFFFLKRKTTEKLCKLKYPTKCLYQNIRELQISKRKVNISIVKWGK